MMAVITKAIKTMESTIEELEYTIRTIQLNNANAIDMLNVIMKMKQ